MQTEILLKLRDRKASSLTDEEVPIVLKEKTWQSWLKVNFSHVTTCPFGTRHIRLWEWFDSLEPGFKPKARVDVWPRGGAKSSTAELATAWVGLNLKRRFVLLVSETQEQADKHVQSIATLFERMDIARAVGKYGSSKGWRRDQLRVCNGFNVAAFGLDVASRGIKLDQFRPDLIIFDDIDNQTDTNKTIEKKIRTLTTAILPAGSSDCAVLFIQNLIRDDGIIAQLVNNQADFLADREPASLEPAVFGLKTEIREHPGAANTYEIVAGTPSWDGQSLEICQSQINTWGLSAFLREAQHEVEFANGYVFNTSQMRTIPASEVPVLTSLCLRYDMAATEGGGDYTVGALMGMTAAGQYYILSIIRGQWSAERVQYAMNSSIKYYRMMYPSLKLSYPQDPGQAGKAQAQLMHKDHLGYSLAPQVESGNKIVRATKFAEQVNMGNVFLVTADLPDYLKRATPESSGKPLCVDTGWDNWHRALKQELKSIKEPEPGRANDQIDDQMDACAGAFNEISIVTVNTVQRSNFRAGNSGYS